MDARLLMYDRVLLFYECVWLCGCVVDEFTCETVKSNTGYTQTHLHICLVNNKIHTLQP